MFEIDDVEEPWTYTEPFDYIHSRMMNSNIGDWDAYVKQCFDNLSPGGYLELNECDIAPCSDDGTLRADSAISKSVQLLQEASEIFGRPFKPMKELKSVLINAGFVDVVMQQYKWPTNDWPLDPRFKVIGSWSNDNISSGWEAVCMANLTRAHGWTREEVIVFMAQCRKEFSDRRIHAYLSM
ncbi:TAM domain methyltransferase [Colletotrichum higginsianum]|nr:TAM domain methyltransferase [Colletotrichum higginsianum]